MLERAAQLLALLAQLIANPAQLRARLVENLATGIDRLPDRADFILERGYLGDELAQDRKIRAGAADARARLVHRIDEVGNHAQLHRLERPADHVERLERLGQRLARSQRKQRVPFEKPHRLAGRRLQRDHDLWIRRRLERRERLGAKRRQRQCRDGVNDPIEFESAGCEHYVRCHGSTETRKQVGFGLAMRAKQ